MQRRAWRSCASDRACTDDTRSTRAPSGHFYRHASRRTVRFSSGSSDLLPVLLSPPWVPLRSTRHDGLHARERFPHQPNRAEPASCQRPDPHLDPRIRGVGFDHPSFDRSPCRRSSPSRVGGLHTRWQGICDTKACRTSFRAGVAVLEQHVEGHFDNRQRGCGALRLGPDHLLVAVRRVGVPLPRRHGWHPGRAIRGQRRSPTLR